MILAEKSATFRDHARRLNKGMTDTDHRASETHCPCCALQCGTRLVAEDGRLVVAPRDFPTNKGGLCRKGFTAAELLDARDRLTVPLVREHKGGALLAVSWDQALDRNDIELHAVAPVGEIDRSAKVVVSANGIRALRREVEPPAGVRSARVSIEIAQFHNSNSLNP
jgi:predicted molibdopterin-dependent oxidoreductase YjgC